MTMKAILRSTCITYRAHFKTCQRPTFCKVLCKSFLEVSVQPLFFQVPQNLIGLGFNLSQYFSHCKNQFDYSTFLDPILHFFKLFHSCFQADFRRNSGSTKLSYMENLCSVTRPQRNVTSSFCTQLIDTQKLYLRNSHSYEHPF